MAAATVASKRYSRIGKQRVVTATLTAPANDDTWATGLTSIEKVTFAFPAGNLAAADSVSYTKSGGTVTIKVVGTARDLIATAYGY